MLRTAVALCAFLGWNSVPAAEEVPLSCRTEGAWRVCDTQSFSVWSRLTSDATIETARICEVSKATLQETWFDRVPPRRWPTRCVVVLHSDPAAYAAAVEQPVTRSVGCTTLQLEHGRVTFRRIDLRCDRPTWQTSALAHELTHAVLADRLGGQPLALWADEGLAVLSEPESTLRKRDDALLAAARRNKLLPLRELLALGSPPPPSLRDGFYGQCAIIVSLLIDRGSPAEFLEFLDDSRSVGYDAALRDHYRLDGVAGLDSLWEQRAALPGVLVEAAGQAALALRFRDAETPVLTRRQTSR